MAAPVSILRPGNSGDLGRNRSLAKPVQGFSFQPHPDPVTAP
jgi:hypothetical protein